MKVSVITAAFNCAATIGETLRSVAVQTWSDVEHIVIDGESTDGTLDVLRRDGKHVARVISEPDRGIYEGMNKGVKLATGDAIAFLNADDVYADSQAIERMAMTMQRGDLDAVFGDVAYFRDETRRIVRRYRSGRFRPARLAWGWMPAHAALFVRRRLFERVGEFKTAYRIAGDYEWIIRAFADGAVRYEYIPEVLVHMRMGGISTKGWRNTVLLNQEVMRACRENGVHTNWLKILSKYPAKMLEFVSR